MQSRNELGEVVLTKEYEDKRELESKLLNDIEEAKSLGAVSHVIGTIPTKGYICEINGLQYEVKFSDRKGEIRLKLVKP